MRNRFASAAIEVLLLVATGAPGVCASAGLRDATFEQVPFDQWRSTKGNPPSFLPWSLDIDPPALSGHQRMMVGIRIQADIKKLSKQHLNEPLLALLQFEDPDGMVWRTHSLLKRQSLNAAGLVQNAFLLPGDYVLSVALWDAEGARHSFAWRRIHVPGLKADPLPAAWEGLPRVEFVRGEAESPEGWFLPEVDSRLHLPVQTQHPVHIDVLLNTTPGDRATDAIGGMRRNMSALLPALKVISQMELSNGSIDVSFLNLTDREEVAIHNWPDVKVFFARRNPGIVNVKALDGRRSMRNFFLERVKGRIGDTAEARHVVIVLSGPAFYEGQQEVAQIGLPQGEVPRVFYIRCREIPLEIREPRPRARPGARPRPFRAADFELPLDDLEIPLYSPGARVFDVISAEQFRRVLASVMGQISRM